MSLDMPKVSPEIYRFEIRIEQLLKIGPLIQSLLNGRRVEKWETPDGSSVKIESRDILYNYNSPQSFIVPQEWNRMSRWFRKISISNANFIFDKNCLKTEFFCNKNYFKAFYYCRNDVRQFTVDSLNKPRS